MLQSIRLKSVSCGILVSLHWNLMAAANFRELHLIPSVTKIKLNEYRSAYVLIFFSYYTIVCDYMTFIIYVWEFASLNWKKRCILYFHSAITFLSYLCSVVVFHSISQWLHMFLKQNQLTQIPDDSWKRCYLDMSFHFQWESR